MDEKPKVVTKSLTHGKIENIILKKDIENGKAHFSMKIKIDESFHCLKLHKRKSDINLYGLNMNNATLSFNEDESELISVTIPVDRDYLLGINK